MFQARQDSRLLGSSGPAVLHTMTTLIDIAWDNQKTYLGNSITVDNHVLWSFAAVIGPPLIKCTTEHLCERIRVDDFLTLFRLDVKRGWKLLATPVGAGDQGRDTRSSRSRTR